MSIATLKKDELVELATKQAKQLESAGNVLHVTKKRKISVEVLNKQLTRMGGKAGTIEKGLSPANQRLLSQAVTISGEEIALFDERAISPLLKAGAITKEQAKELRTVCRFRKASIELANL